MNTDEAPGAMPSDDEIRAQVRAIPRGIEFLPTGDNPRWTPERLAKLSPGELAALREGKLARCPGRYADPVDIELHAQHETMRRNRERIEQLEAEHNAVAEYDRRTGEPLYVASEERRRAMRAEAEQLRSEMEAVMGEAGERRLHIAEDKAVAARKALLRQQHINALAEQRAVELEQDQEVTRRALMLLRAKGIELDADPIRRG
jgi:hypothetical protein